MDIRVGSRQGGHGNGFRGGAPFKKRQYLTGDFARDMLSLRIKGRIRSPQTRKETYVDETPQFITYLTPGSNNFSADGKVYFPVSEVHIELYTDEKNPETEQIVEDVLDAHEIFYNKSEVWIESELLYEVLYSFEMEG